MLYVPDARPEATEFIAHLLGFGLTVVQSFLTIF